MAKLILIRHGELPESCSGRYIGVTDPPLSPEGAAQCRALRNAPELQPHGPVYVSPRRRAQESAEWIFGKGTAFQVDERLREIDFGAWEMLNFEEIRKCADPALLKIWAENPEKMAFPQGESIADTTARVRSFLAELLPQKHPAPPVLVTHSGFLTNLLCYFTRIPLNRQQEVRMPRGTLKVVEVPAWVN